jgi:hypothetical protein
VRGLALGQTRKWPGHSESGVDFAGRHSIGLLGVCRRPGLKSLPGRAGPSSCYSGLQRLAHNDHARASRLSLPPTPSSFNRPALACRESRNALNIKLSPPDRPLCPSPGDELVAISRTSRCYKPWTGAPFSRSSDLTQLNPAAVLFPQHPAPPSPPPRHDTRPTLRAMSWSTRTSSRAPCACSSARSSQLCLRVYRSVPHSSSSTLPRLLR